MKRGGDQPRVNAGSPTYPVDVSAALTSDGKFLTLAVVNPTESAQKLDLTINGVDLRGKGRLWHMTGPGINAVTGLSRHEVQVVEMPVGEVPRRSRSRRSALTCMSSSGASPRTA